MTLSRNFWTPFLVSRQRPAKTSHNGSNIFPAHKFPSRSMPIWARSDTCWVQLLTALCPRLLGRLSPSLRLLNSRKNCERRESRRQFMTAKRTTTSLQVRSQNFTLSRPRHEPQAVASQSRDRTRNRQRAEATPRQLKC